MQAQNDFQYIQVTTLQYIMLMKKNEQKQNRKRLNSQSTLQKLPPLNKKQSPNDKPSLSNISHQDEGIVGLLYEYFIKNNFMDTLDTFQKDCQDKGFKPNNKFIQSFRQEILQAFQKGDRDTFMARFTQFVPISMRNKDPQTMKLEFYIQVYFFVYSIHPQLGKKRAIDTVSKQAFIGYLEGRGATIAKLQQFLPYYALAYLQKPQEHPSFKTLFTRQWIGQLKKQLIYYIQKLYPIGKIPVIINIYDKFIERNLQKSSQQSITEPDDQLQIEQQIEPQQSQVIANNQVSSRAQQNGRYNQSLKQPNTYDQTDRQKQSMSLKIAELQQQKNQLIKFIENVKKKYQSLQNNYKDFTDAAQNTLMQSQSKWFKITQEFYNMASNLKDVCVKIQNNQPLDDPNVVQKIGKKLSKYESFVKMNIQDLISENVDFSLFERPQHDQSVDMVRKNNDDRPQYLIQLDYQKIRSVLSNSNPDLDVQKIYLLQALKRRITKTRGALLKRQIVLGIVMNDIFNLKKGDQTIKNLLNHKNQAVLTKIMEFLNALAKDYFGRNYLSCQPVVKNAMNILKNQKASQNTIIIAVSFLQQLSVRKTAQKVMIQGQMIRWIVTKLKKQRETMSQYSMQYSLAIIINLLLKKQGLQKSQQIKQEILTTLIDLMEIQIIQIRQYVHGAIYPLFHKRVFRQKAKQYGLQENITFLLQNTQSQYLINQLRHLQKQLMREDEEKQQQNQENEQQQDLDQINDEQLGEDFDFEADEQPGGGLSGQQLLIKMYPLTGPDAMKQLNMIRQQAQLTLKNKSIYVASNFSERPSTNNPKVGMRKNISNNNSVYSNRSSNRVLKSQLMNRSQLNRNPARQKLDTVHPDNSQKQMSVKDFIDDQSQFVRIQNSSQRNSRKRQQSEKFQKQKLDQVRGSSQNNILQNGSFKVSNNQAQQQKESNRHRSLKPYQNSQQYQQGFITRSKLVRTPPQK